jgi:hypothetical protein
MRNALIGLIGATAFLCSSVAMAQSARDPAAVNVSPRIGHSQVTVDDAPWRWAEASGEPLIINGLPAGPHKVRIQLVNANHQTLDQGVVNFVIPWRRTTRRRARGAGPPRAGPRARQRGA